MPKPEWLIENERKSAVESSLRRCGRCKFIGSPVRIMKSSGKVAFDCKAHPGRTTTDDAYACTEWQAADA